MRIRAAGIVALLVIAGFVTSAVAPCVAGAMAPRHEQMASCRGGHDHGDRVSSGDPANCCKYSDPQLTPGKVNLLKAPIRHVLQWLTPAPAAVIVPAAISIASTGSPPRLTTALGPPAYIVLSTLLI